MASYRLKIAEFEWDANNKRECSDHGLTCWRLNEIWLNRPLYFRNKPGKSGVYLMIGPDDSGRFWAVPILPTGKDGQWRPVTGWPAEKNDMELYEKENARLTRIF
jgi:uncharacterized DUF497 family protein